MFLYLSLVLEEELSYVGILKLEVWFVDSNNVGAHGFHFAEKSREC